jgi:ketosteroid isomerase-like protein
LILTHAARTLEPMSPDAPSDPSATGAVMERFYAAITQLDEAALREVFHDDAELHQPPNLPYGGIYRGVGEMVQLWRTVVIPLADLSTAFLDSMVIDGEHAVTIGGMNMATSGAPSLVCEDYLVRDGKISRIRVFWFDPSPVIAQAIANGVGTT